VENLSSSIYLTFDVFCVVEGEQLIVDNSSCRSCENNWDEIRKWLV